ncbi:NAD-dependent epimerase/dehydratase family protein [Sphingobacterium haloxyli]|uniref:Epimerase n=1 Tax=Sphingobacterium haloxyli TaxID=2100533 RepID=A0A2S9J5S3_9SPHI|nr:NAD(P)-dependent oxidoreductase [Sphingobacterium haloxyli]PRD48121.1 epimerase [Sphingobacterium haloxyli]
MDLKELEEKYTRPSNELVKDVHELEGDIMLLGIAGKMGVSMGSLLVDALRQAGKDNRVYGVSRFSDNMVKQQVDAGGVTTIACDLLHNADLQALPDVPNIIYLAGHKFGTTGNEDFTWAMNTYLPGRVAEKFRKSNIVAFSSGNVLPFVKLQEGGADENILPQPVGEYAQSCLGRERVFQYFSKKNGTPILIYRLNYAVDFRYGVVMEIAKAVLHGQAIDLRTENVNVIWQGDANEIAIRSLLHCTSPAKVLNVTGPETLSIRWLAKEFGKLFNREPLFQFEAEGTALLNNASECHRLFGYPKVSIREIIDITGNWLLNGGDEFGKPTHFQERGGQF